MTTQTLKFVTLHCAIGDHDWERTSQRGKRPLNCPEHKPSLDEVVKKIGPTQIISGPAREQAIREIIEAEFATNCTCPIEVTMGDDELQALGGGCTDPNHVCSILDKVRRRVVNYNRHWDEDDFDIALLEEAA